MLHEGFQLFHVTITLTLHLFSFYSPLRHSTSNHIDFAVSSEQCHKIKDRIISLRTNPN
jgi:hypothetical protein